MKSNKELKSNIKTIKENQCNCEECCDKLSYKTGQLKGRQEMLKEFEQIIDNLEIDYLDDDGEPFDRPAGDFMLELKQKLKEKFA
jgi:hypothetical protein